MIIYQLKITLIGVSKPKVWRRLRIPADMMLADLHTAIQDAMGWEDCHLYQFTDVRKQYDYDMTWRAAEPYEYDDEYDVKTQDSKAVTISKYLKEAGDKIMYTYDFGDSWRHEILLEKLENEEKPIVRCIGGKGACPPEDIGGIGMYEGMKEIFAKDPLCEEANSYRMWMGYPPGVSFDADYFSLREANDNLRFSFGWLKD